MSRSRLPGSPISRLGWPVGRSQAARRSGFVGDLTDERFVDGFNTEVLVRFAEQRSVSYSIIGRSHAVFNWDCIHPETFVSRVSWRRSRYKIGLAEVETRPTARCG